MSASLTIPRPAFSAIDLDTVESRLDELLAHCRQTLDKAATVSDPDWDSLMQPQEEAHNALDLFWSPISHLHSVMNTAELRAVYQRCLPKLSAYYTELGQHTALHAATRSLRDGPRYAALTPARQKALNNDLRDFELGGVSLVDTDKRRYAEIEARLSELGNRFSDNVLDATKAWERPVDDEAALVGMPASAIAAARQRASDKEREGFLLTLEFPSYLAVMTFADDRELREAMYAAFMTRASDQGPDAGRWDNGPLIDEILALKAEKAALLGYANHAELSVVPKMVESPAQVMAFLEDLAERARPQAQAEFDELTAFAIAELGIDVLQGWDIAYAGDKLKQQRHALSDEDLKPYFPASKVIPGMFAVVSRLFGMTIEPVADAEVYHPDVQVFSITDADGRRRGEMYLDNYARENKRSGAWMGVCATRMRVGTDLQLPIAWLTCNLTPPVGDDPALLTHNEVTTLFHEFGHGLHHMLTQVDTAGVSGISGVEWDAVELPSQFMENWCWERESLDMISEHYETGEPLPDDLLERLRGARNFQSAMQLVRQLELALFDMRIHIESTVDQPAAVQQTLDQVRGQVAVVPVPSWNRFQHTFAHIFAGGYSAGYFSYKWAEVLSADAFARFEDEGIFDATAGRDFLEQVLEQGGSRPAVESFKAFRGREPDVAALLRHSGLAA